MRAECFDSAAAPTFRPCCAWLRQLMQSSFAGGDQWLHPAFLKGTWLNARLESPVRAESRFRYSAGLPSSVAMLRRDGGGASSAAPWRIPMERGGPWTGGLPAVLCAAVVPTPYFDNATGSVA